MGYMGPGRAIATLKCKVRPLPSTRLAKQRIGCGAVRGGFVVMRFDAGNLCFKQSHAFIELVLRIWGQILGGEAARGISLDAGQIVVFHQGVTSQANPLAVNARNSYSHLQQTGRKQSFHFRLVVACLTSPCPKQ